MVVVVNMQREEPAPWSVWWAANEPPADGVARMWHLKCSVCLQELKCAVVFPEHGLRVCFACLTKIKLQADKACFEPSSAPSGTGPASVGPVPSPSRGTT